MQATNPDICTQLAVQVHDYFIIPLVLNTKLLRFFFNFQFFQKCFSKAEFLCSSCCCVNAYIMGIASAIHMISKLILPQQREIFNIKICIVHCRSKQMQFPSTAKQSPLISIMVLCILATLQTAAEFMKWLSLMDFPHLNQGSPPMPAVHFCSCPCTASQTAGEQ